jgi:hypothetical protein
MKIRHVLAAGSLAAASLAPMFAASPANAIPICRAGYECSYVYYATITRTPPPIGYVYLFCNGTSSTWGKTSAYFTFSESQCGSGAARGR